MLTKKKDIPKRNDKCSCGSGKKAKKCCYDKIQAEGVYEQPELRVRLKPGLIEENRSKKYREETEPECETPNLITQE